ncbi:MAG TPA: lysophospholipid acyltransferase family protein [Candidatus Acidoferrales bacterium]|nr:lysophospholipid acyltransferase family protein [Candidatus Acidoferrales bacterium]
MNFKKARLWLLCRLSEAAFWIVCALLKALPPATFRGIARPLVGVLIAGVVPKRRIVKNLSAAFGESYSLASKKGLARGVQDHFVKNLIDCFFQLRFPGYTRQVVRIEGKENLDAALAKGRGIIALGAHIGNFVLVGTRLGSEGLKVHTLFRLPKDQRVQALIKSRVAGFHQRLIPSFPRRPAVSAILQALRQNEVVFILADNLRGGKIQTKFFGQRVRTSRGPVSLALRSGAAVVPVYLIRSYAGDLKLVIEPEMELVRTGNLAADVLRNTARLASYLEQLIRRYPDQWNWLTVRMRGALDARAPQTRPQDAALSPTLNAPAREHRV